MTGRYRRAGPRRAPDADADGAERVHPPRRPPTPEEQRDALLAYAFRALGQRALSAQELRARLERRSDDPELVAQVLARVQELGYQDDTQVARAENTRRGVGAVRVRHTLKRRGLDEELIQDALQTRDPAREAEEVAALLERRWPSFARKRDPQASAFAFLARRGYPGSVIWPAIRAFLAAQDQEPDWSGEEETD
ncbi:RecX family transcriptional regulator [Deinococcus arcticus]|uniref:Regulatory protein RecX n=1 Tax=Deinococcus arcticus TaxID=2136176 RepID=A0A2T3WBK8_9DEIO|nr:RecX family transcriptional regulator [Deinococcus arcticus]PTA69288.1 recombination regulator RecX [Deinococcus arcticus]